MERVAAKHEATLLQRLGPVPKPLAEQRFVVLLLVHSHIHEDYLIRDRTKSIDLYFDWPAGFSLEHFAVGKLKFYIFATLEFAEPFFPSNWQNHCARASIDEHRTLDGLVLIKEIRDLNLYNDSSHIRFPFGSHYTTLAVRGGTEKRL